MANTLSVIFRLNDNFSSPMKSIITATAQAEKQQTQLNKALKNMHGTMGDASGTRVMSDGINSITRRITGLVSAAYLGKKALDVMFAAVKTGAEKQVQLNTFQSLLNSDEAGQALYNYTNLYGKQKSVLGSMGIANATKSFLPFTQDINQMTKLYQLTERLYARDPTQGSEGAVFAMKELISGDVMSARERFNISGISGAKIRDLVNAGDMNGTLNYLDAVFNKFGVTQGIVDKNFTSLQTQATKFGDNVRSALGDESSPIVQNLSTMFQQLNADMDAGKFAPFFNLVGNGMYFLGSGLSWLAQNLSTIVPVVGGLSMALLAYKTVTVIATTATSAMHIVLASTTGNWIALSAAIAGAATAYGIYKNMDSIAGSAGSGAAKSVEDAQKAAEQAIAKAQKLGGSGAVNAEITNTAPIPVKGEVEIEKESLRYQFDLAAQKAMAMFNLQQITPQVSVHVERVEKIADMEEVANYLGDVVSQNQQTQAAGVYA
ncbi:hypothetical protein [Faecalispora jeddahensis]|uniref:hypothetical protein n=1 Tax=Faecalispora jeddahensis TaxID=1414721 RepID=UPI0004BBFCAC|nr:hypothetical protein [Faecalispora jeddahensis]